MLTFTDRQVGDIGDSNPQDANSVGILDDNLIIIHPAVEIPGVDTTMDPAEITRVDPDFDVRPTGVDMDTDAWVGLCRPNFWSAEFYFIYSYVNVYLTCT